MVVLDQSIDTSTPAGRLLFNVLGSIAQFELDVIRERTAVGVAAARRRGARFGRPKALSPEASARVARMSRSGQSVRYIATMLGVGKSTIAAEVARLRSASA
jgi:DNA invertase Pin-like site-specific DNA recombinase